MVLYRNIYELDIIGMYINRQEFNNFVNTVMLLKEKRYMPDNIHHPIYQYIYK
jgi:hypothetical protein